MDEIKRYKVSQGFQQLQADLDKIEAMPEVEAVKEGLRKANSAYQKPQTGIPAGDLADGVIPDVRQFVTKTVNDLVNYYTKSETYTKQQVQELIAAIPGFTYEGVEELPQPPSAATMWKLYLVPSSDPQASNVKDEFITIDNGASAETRYTWEQVGSTAIDLSGYVTTEALNTALADYVTSGALATALAGLNDVKYTQQTLSAAQKAQARQNIDAISLVGGASNSIPLVSKSGLDLIPSDFRILQSDDLVSIPWNLVGVEYIKAEQGCLPVSLGQLDYAALTPEALRNYDLEVEIVFSYEQATKNKNIFGSYLGSSKNSYELAIDSSGNNFYVTVCTSPNAPLNIPISELPPNAIHTVVINNDSVTINGGEPYQSPTTQASGQNSSQIVLFGYDTTHSGACPLGTKIYRFVVRPRTGSSSAKDLVPVKNKTVDSIFGFYDLSNDEYISANAEYHCSCGPTLPFRFSEPIENGDVKYGKVQNLTDEQKAQARENIGAGDAETVQELDEKVNGYTTTEWTVLEAEFTLRLKCLRSSSTSSTTSTYTDGSFKIAIFRVVNGNRVRITAKKPAGSNIGFAKQYTDFFAYSSSSQATSFDRVASGGAKESVDAGTITNFEFLCSSDGYLAVVGDTSTPPKCELLSTQHTSGLEDRVEDLEEGAEMAENKSQDIETDKTSTTKYPSTKAVADYVVAATDAEVDAMMQEVLN